MQTNEMSKVNINKLVVLFYTRVLSDEKLAPFFIEKLGADLKGEKWQAHMELLTNFWTTLVTGSRDYNGAPFPPHAHIQGLDRTAFETWIVLFFESVDKVFTSDIASKFKERGAIIAGNFVRKLNL